MNTIIRILILLIIVFSFDNCSTTHKCNKIPKHGKSLHGVCKQNKKYDWNNYNKF